MTLYGALVVTLTCYGALKWRIIIIIIIIINATVQPVLSCKNA